MKETISPAPSISELEPGESVSYRAVSRLAVTALLLGAASSLALVHPLLWIIPPAAALVAIFALRVIAAHSTELVGRGAALAGLALALLFGTLAPAWLMSRQGLVYAEARTHADAWLEMVREGKLHEAYELHLPARERHTSSASLHETYGDAAQLTESTPVASPLDMMRPDPRASFRNFFSAPPVNTLVVTGKAGELVFVGNESQSHRAEAFADDITLRYELRFDDRGPTRNSTFLITLTRTYEASARRATWHVTSVREPG